MIYTVTCPDPECKTTFEVEEDLLELDIEESDPIDCPGCEVPYDWDFDADRDPPLMLTGVAEFDDEDEDDLEDIESDDEEEGNGE